MLADLLAVADAASAPRFHLWRFGHGASISRHLAARSDRVISAVLIGADMGPTLSGPVKDAIAGMRAKWQPLLDAQKAGTLDLKQFSYGDREAWNNGVAISAIALGALAEYPPLEPVGDSRRPRCGWWVRPTPAPWRTPRRIRASWLAPRSPSRT